MKYESGVHRVQRVPQTETQGRIHTSAASVVVLPEADEFDIDLRTEDIPEGHLLFIRTRRPVGKYNIFCNPAYPYSIRYSCYLSG